MAVSPPDIDKRTAAVVAQQVQDLARLYAAPPDAAPDWQLNGLGDALVGVAARFSEIVIQRLNQVPQKNFLAFLNLLGAALLPPQPAQVPLTFYLAKGSLADGLVPAGTQVAAPPGPNDKDPVIFETQHELMVTAAQLVALFTRDPARDMYSDYSAAAASAVASGAPVFHGNRKTEHVLYIGDALLGLTGIGSLTLLFTLKVAGLDTQLVQWEFWDGSDWVVQVPATDTTRSLQQSGSVVFSGLSPVPLQTVQSVVSNWLRCRLMTPITTETDARKAMVRGNQLPQVQAVTLNATIGSSGQPVKAGFTNQTPLDLTKDFYPFGEKPKFADAFYLQLDPNFARPGATIVFNVNVTNPKGSNPRGADTSSPPYGVEPSADLSLHWEVWSDGNWEPIGTSTPTGSQPAGFVDKTNAFSNPGVVNLALPKKPVQVTIGGVTGIWLRVRIASGHYGLEAHWRAVADAKPPNPSYEFLIDTFAPPALAPLSVDYSYNAAGTPDAILTDNDFAVADVTTQNQHGGFAPFVPMQDTRPTLYFGFRLPPGRSSFLGNPLSLFLVGANLKFGETTVPLSPDISKAAAEPGQIADHLVLLTNSGADPVSFNFDLVGAMWQSTTDQTTQTVPVDPGSTRPIHLLVTVPGSAAMGDSDTGFLRLLDANSQPWESAAFITYAHAEAIESQQLQIAWEYWNGFEWAATAVADNSNNFVEDGVIEFLPPPDFSLRAEFALDPCCWLRALWQQGEFDREPRMRRVLANTVMGSQTTTIRNEVLGSSDGSASQQFQTTRKPVLTGQSLVVREQEQPSTDEAAIIRQEEGSDAISVVLDAVGQPKEIWVRWHEVNDFYASNARSRHYTLDHLTGQVTFGDGLSGLIPPAGNGSVQMSTYRTGGGSRGNVAAETIVQLKTTLPYVDKVTNLEAAGGGAEGETTDSLIVRAPTEIRHRGRAVTSEDYEDLAHLASPDVARVLCVPNRDLAADPFSTQPAVPGNVSVMIVPQSRDNKPQPSFALVDRVQQFLDASSPANVNVVVVGPLYIRVDVQTEIGLANLDSAGTVVQKVQNQLAAFLHPLTGGFEGTGWQFGRAPHRSDLYALLKQIPEADHIRSLVVTEVEDAPGTRETGRFLVYSGNHTIQLVYEPS